MADLVKRDWLFPVILGTLLSGCVVSFAMAWNGRVVQHVELKMSASHSRILSPSTPTADRLPADAQ